MSLNWISVLILLLHFYLRSQEICFSFFLFISYSLWFLETGSPYIASFEHMILLVQAPGNTYHPWKSSVLPSSNPLYTSLCLLLVFASCLTCHGKNSKLTFHSTLRNKLKGWSHSVLLQATFHASVEKPISTWSVRLRTLFLCLQW